MSSNNQNNQSNAGSGGCIHGLSLVVFIFGALMMYPKTVDLLSKFAPNEFLGYTDLAGWWAAGSALLIEGVLVTWKIKMWIYPAQNLSEWAGDVILSIVPFALSALAQVFDSMMNQDALAQQPAEIQLLVTWGVPLLPSVMVFLLLGWSLIQSAPGIFGEMNGGSFSVPNPFAWLKRSKKNTQQPKPQPQDQPKKKGNKQEDPTHATSS